ncbi:uncharacterized protein LOC117304698 isoform X1 [Asterias rubens]|uniref:uncharacterized protein LOC117304698 isoform X1 n=2 Tax=Asterias rubens TaxID=7604 RepID=UPI0014553C68|nr:uncharacterized protein LOC117304698 isoform X1 [Asterias rubens]
METSSAYDTLPSGNNWTVVSGSPYTDVLTTYHQESASVARKYMENMSSILYAIAGAVVVLCILIHGCLFYRRWRLKRVRASVTGSPERGWSWFKTPGKATYWSKTPGKATNFESSTMDAIDIELGDHKDLVSSDSSRIHLAKSSPSSSLLDQDLNERRRSSTRIRVLPALALSRSSSAASGQPENGPDEGDSEDGLSSNFSKSLTMDAVEKNETSKCTSDVTASPGNEPCSEYELLQCGTAGTPNEQDTKPDTICKPNTIPTILQTQPSEEHTEYQLLNAGVQTRTNIKKHPKDLFKRRSYSFDNVPVLGAGGYAELKQTISATLKPGRGRSASESQGHSPKSQKNKVSFDDTSLSGTSNADPTYFTLVPDSEQEPNHSKQEPNHDKRYRTLPPIKTNITKTDESSGKRKLGLSSFKFSRKSKTSDKKKTKTPPSSPARKTNPETSSAIYEEPEFIEEPNPATCPVYFSLEQPEKSAIGKCQENILSKDSKTGTKSLLFKNSPKNHKKSKGTRNIISYKKNPDNENSKSADDGYEDLEASAESSKVDDSPVYDTLEPGPVAPPVPSNKNSGPVIGRTTTGAPLRQFKPANRELPKRPSQNVYDCIERGAFPSPGSNQRSQTLLPTTRRGSSPSSQRFNQTPSTAYDSLCPSTLPEQLKAATLRRGSSPEPARSQPDAVYDLLDPETFSQQASDGSAKKLALRPGVGPKPKSLRLQRNTSLTYDTLHEELQIRRGSLGTRPAINTSPKPLIRTSSLSKIQRGRPDISPKPSPRGQDSVSTKPVVPKKPTINGNTNGEDPVYFTLNADASSEPI